MPVMCRRMRESPYPHGVDRWFFSPNFCPAEKLTFPNWSLAGQVWGQSDSWNKLNIQVGEIESPPDDWKLELRRFSESPDLLDARRKIWQKHRERDRLSRKRGTFGFKAHLMLWNKSPRSIQGRTLRLRPAASGSMAAASSKASAPAPRSQMSEEEHQDMMSGLWRGICNRG